MADARLITRFAISVAAFSVAQGATAPAHAQAAERGRLRMPHRMAKKVAPPTTALAVPAPLATALPMASSAAVAGDGEVAEVVVHAERRAHPIASQLDHTRATHAGSVTTVSSEQLALQKASNLGEVLARIPGVVYVDEDGRGTKPDIGLRGQNPIRSEYVQLLHDGVPTQPSMYSEQAAYYGVPAERVQGIEVYRGGAAVLFGPNTMGGVINLISRSPSQLPLSLVLDARLDSYGDALGNVFVSGTSERVSYGVEYMHKGGSGFRDNLDYRIDDVDLRLGYQLGERHSARAHFQFYDERSETPGGLLPAQFRADRTLSNKPNDEFFGRRIEGDLSTRHELTERQRLETLFYAYFFQRNWFLQNFADNATEDLTLADNNGQFLRDFHVVGFEPKYTLDYDLGPSQGHRLSVGGRVYYDRVDRRAQTGNTATSGEDDGVPTSDEELSSFVVAAYAQTELSVFEGFSVVPGLRYEHIEQTRTDVFAGSPEQSSDYDAWVPGVGVKYLVLPGTLAYANVTRAFRPPSFGDSFNPAIGASSFDLAPSTAWIYETGVRVDPYAWLFAEAGVFYMDFADQVVVSAGAAENFDTRSYGFEGSLQLGLCGLGRAVSEGRPDTVGEFELFLQGGASLIDAEFVDGAFAGNDLPYAPSVTGTFGVLLELKRHASLGVQGRHLGARFTDNANTQEEDAIGSIGELSAYTVFDVKGRWQVLDVLALNLGVNNLLDEGYGTQRRNGSQKGIFPGPTRAFYVAASASF